MPNAKFELVFDITRPGHKLVNMFYSNAFSWALGFVLVCLPAFLAGLGLFIAPLIDHNFTELFVWITIAAVTWPLLIYVSKNTLSYKVKQYCVLLEKFYRMPQWKQKEYIGVMHQQFVFYKNGDKGFEDKLYELFDAYRRKDPLALVLDTELEIVRTMKELNDEGS